MDTMSIDLTTTLKTYVYQQVEAGGYSSASEYIHRLIREDQQRKAVEEIDRKLLEALDSGPATLWTAEHLAELKRRVRERHPQIQSWCAV